MSINETQILTYRPDFVRDALKCVLGPDEYMPSIEQVSFWTDDEKEQVTYWADRRGSGERPAVLNMSFEVRMKRYEGYRKPYVDTNLPIVIRLDGKSFSNFTRKFERPFDKCITSAMDAATLALCEEVQPCLLAYTQSDEITLVMGAYKNVNSQPWFNGSVQKIASVAASIVTLAFNLDLLESHNDPTLRAYFDCRVWNLPSEEEVVNSLIWRQNDAMRNSVAMVASSVFSHRQLQGVSVAGMKDLLVEHGTPWESFPIRKTRGAMCYPVDQTGSGSVIRRGWSYDTDIPVFSDNRIFLEGMLESKTRLQ